MKGVCVCEEGVYVKRVCMHEEGVCVCEEGVYVKRVCMNEEGVCVCEEGVYVCQVSTVACHTMKHLLLKVLSTQEQISMYCVHNMSSVLCTTYIQ